MATRAGLLRNRLIYRVYAGLFLSAHLAFIIVDNFFFIAALIGGMLGIRYALMYPSQVDRLVLVDPIGLEDWKARGVPWQSVDAWYQQELHTTADGIRNYERTTYY